MHSWMLGWPNLCCSIQLCWPIPFWPFPLSNWPLAPIPHRPFPSFGAVFSVCGLNSRCPPWQWHLCFLDLAKALCGLGQTLIGGARQIGLKICCWFLPIIQFILFSPFLDPKFARPFPHGYRPEYDSINCSFQCLDAGHLLALEAQFLLLCLLALHFLAHPRQARPFLLIATLLITLLLNCLLCLGISLLFRLPPTLIPHRPIDPRHFGQLLDLLILNPLARAGPPIVGILFAKSVCPLLRNGQWVVLLRASSPSNSPIPPIHPQYNSAWAIHSLVISQRVNSQFRRRYTIWKP